MRISVSADFLVFIDHAAGTRIHIDISHNVKELRRRIKAANCLQIASILHLARKK